MILAKDMPFDWLRKIRLEIHDVIILHAELQTCEECLEVEPSLTKFFDAGGVVLTIEGVKVTAIWDNSYKLIKLV